MKKPVNFASVLLIAAALVVWVWQHPTPADKRASPFSHAAAAQATTVR